MLLPGPIARFRTAISTRKEGHALSYITWRTLNLAVRMPCRETIAATGSCGGCIPATDLVRTEPGTHTRMLMVAGIRTCHAGKPGATRPVTWCLWRTLQLKISGFNDLEFFLRLAVRSEQQNCIPSSIKASPPFTQRTGRDSMPQRILAGKTRKAIEWKGVECRAINSMLSEAGSGHCDRMLGTKPGPRNPKGGEDAGDRPAPNLAMSS